MAKRIGLRGENLQQARENLHMTQGELAVALGIANDPESRAGKATISRYENGHHQPGSETLDKMTEVLNVSADWLLGRVSDPRGSVTPDSLPPDEVEVLHAYRTHQIGKMVDLGMKKRDEAGGNEPGKS